MKTEESERKSHEIEAPNHTKSHRHPPLPELVAVRYPLHHRAGVVENIIKGTVQKALGLLENMRRLQSTRILEVMGHLHGILAMSLQLDTMTLFLVTGRPLRAQPLTAA